jgi:hypothetical protein
MTKPVYCIYTVSGKSAPHQKHLSITYLTLRVPMGSKRTHAEHVYVDKFHTKSNKCNKFWHFAYSGSFRYPQRMFHPLDKICLNAISPPGTTGVQTDPTR